MAFLVQIFRDYIYPQLLEDRFWYFPYSLCGISSSWLASAAASSSTSSPSGARGRDMLAHSPHHCTHCLHRTRTTLATMSPKGARCISSRDRLAGASSVRASRRVRNERVARSPPRRRDSPPARPASRTDAARGSYAQ